MKMTQCTIGKIGLLDKNTLFVDIESGKEIGLEHIYEFKNVAKELSQNQNLYTIVNYGAYTLPTAEAREFCAAAWNNSRVLARAFVVHDLGQMILAKHILKQHKNTTIRVFTEVKKAEVWVKGMQLKNERALLSLSAV